MQGDARIQRAMQMPDLLAGFECKGAETMIEVRNKGIAPTPEIVGMLLEPQSILWDAWTPEVCTTMVFSALVGGCGLCFTYFLSPGKG